MGSKQKGVSWGGTHTTQITNQLINTSTPGFTAILLQLSFANWIIDYPIVSPFAGNWRIGEFWGVKGGMGGSGGGSGSRLLCV